MRICLINPLYGRDSLITYSPPLGLAYIAAVLEQKGHEIRIVDRVATKYAKREIDLIELDKITQRQILEFEPELIGLGAMTIQVYDLAHVIKIIRQMNNGNNYILIVGGVHSTAEPELTLTYYPEIDIVCRGEGEFVMADLASGKKHKDIPGLTFKNNGKFYSTNDRVVPDNLDILPFPARHLLDMHFYSRRNDVIVAYLPLKAATLLTSRGCPYNCKFCSSKMMFKSTRYHSPEYVLQEIALLLESYPLEAVSFVDSELLPPRSRLQRICQELINRKINKKLKWACSLRANLVDKEILMLMKEAGCIYANYGFESGSQKMLNSMDKKVTVEDNYRAARLTTEAGILVMSAMIVNQPDETEEDVLATIDFIKNNKNRLYCVGLNPLLPLPGSPYYREFLEKGLIQYSDKLWEDVGILPKSIDQIKLYSQIPKEKAMRLYSQAFKLVMCIDNMNYLRRNWLRHPLFVYNKLVKPLLKKVLTFG